MCFRFLAGNVSHNFRKGAESGITFLLLDIFIPARRPIYKYRVKTSRLNQDLEVFVRVQSRFSAFRVLDLQHSCKTLELLDLASNCKTIVNIRIIFQTFKHHLCYHLLFPGIADVYPGHIAVILFHR